MIRCDILSEYRPALVAGFIFATLFLVSIRSRQILSIFESHHRNFTRVFVGERIAALSETVKQKITLPESLANPDI